MRHDSIPELFDDDEEGFFFKRNKKIFFSQQFFSKKLNKGPCFERQKSRPFQFFGRI